MAEHDKYRLKKGDYMILIVMFFLLVLLLLLITRNEQGSRVCITVNGQTATYSLFADRKIPISNNENTTERTFLATNTVVIQNGQVYMESATCPDQVCVKHKSISKNGEMIICLPNKVFVEIESDHNSEIDN